VRLATRGVGRPRYATTAAEPEQQCSQIFFESGPRPACPSRGVLDSLVVFPRAARTTDGRTTDGRRTYALTRGSPLAGQRRPGGGHGRRTFCHHRPNLVNSVYGNGIAFVVCVMVRVTSHGRHCLSRPSGFSSDGTGSAAAHGRRVNNDPVRHATRGLGGEPRYKILPPGGGVLRGSISSPPSVLTTDREPLSRGRRETEDAPSGLRGSSFKQSKTRSTPPPSVINLERPRVEWPGPGAGRCGVAPGGFD